MRHVDEHQPTGDPVLTITAAVHDAMVAHALRGLPHEACGLLSADRGTTAAHTFHPMRNAAASSELYQLDGLEMMGVERSVDDAGTEIVAVMHSHTHTTAYPSPTDVRDAAAFDPFGAWHYVIVSLKDAIPVLRSYRIIDGVIAEEPLVVV